jgi:uncharacterized protein YcaQ
MSKLELSKSQACYLALKHQGLTKNNPFGKGVKGLVALVEHLGYVQIDTISVVERAHHHTIWSRLPQYKKDMLDQCMNKKDGIFEYWSHAAAYLPMKDFRYSLIRKQKFISGANSWFERDDKIIQSVYERIKAEGPLSARDFTQKSGLKQNGWWSWKPEKKALEQLFLEGRLMVSKRQGFQKVYDLAERVLPEGTDVSTPSMEEYCEYLIMRNLSAHGFASLEQLCYLMPKVKPGLRTILDRLKEQKLVLECSIKGSSECYFISGDTDLDKLNPRYQNKVKILSPFDNCVIQRNRLVQIFDFEYLFECYVPKAKRKYGYFSLPLLHKNRFIGMMDCKAHRKDKVLEILSIHIDSKAPHDVEKLLGESVKNFARFNECNEVLCNQTLAVQ